jgi:hypothetical protein
MEELVQGFRLAGFAPSSVVMSIIFSIRYSKVELFHHGAGGKLRDDPPTRLQDAETVSGLHPWISFLSR